MITVQLSGIKNMKFDILYENVNQDLVSTIFGIVHSDLQFSKSDKCK